MQEFKSKISALIGSRLNLNIFGENGCGKSELITTIFRNEYRTRLKIPITLTDFLNIPKVFSKILNYITEDISIKYPSHFFQKKIKTWCDLFNILKDYSFLEPYFILDGIYDVETLLFFKKDVFKVLSIVTSFERVKIVLISTFDIVKSEMKNFFDFSSFISICFPLRKRDDNEYILNKHLKHFANTGNVYHDIINKCISNYEYAISNLNEVLYCARENFETFCTISDKNFDNGDLLNSVGMDIENTKTNGSTNSFDTIYCVDNIDNVVLNKSIYQQIRYSPIHIRGVNPDIMSQEDYIELKSASYKKSLLYSGKNLTESLSFSQKIILLSAFYASFTSPYNDHLRFQKAEKSGKLLKDNGFSLKSRAQRPFHIPRLIAIYGAFLRIITAQEQREEDINVELISDIETLESLNMIKALRDDEHIVMNRRFICCIGIDLAVKIANDFNIHLGDFVYYDNSL